MTTASDPTLAQRWELAKRFPKWARRECTCLEHPDRACNSCLRDGVLTHGHSPGGFCENCAGLSYLPLAENDMLVAVLRECRERGWQVSHEPDGRVIIRTRVFRGGADYQVQDSLFAAFLAATEGTSAIDHAQALLPAPWIICENHGAVEIGEPGAPDALIKVRIGATGLVDRAVQEALREFGVWRAAAKPAATEEEAPCSTCNGSGFVQLYIGTGEVTPEGLAGMQPCPACM